MRALIVDDHPIARRGLAALLREGMGISQILEADGADTALILAREHRPDLVLVDLHMPGSAPARELCGQLRAILPSSAIVVMTAFERVSEIRDCLEAGANGCLLKDTAEVDLAGALATSIRGQTIIDPRIAQKLAGGLTLGVGEQRAARITSREREVLALLAEGKSNRRIAEQLVISEPTVKGYVSSLLRKLGASSRLEAVVRASQAGLI